MNNELYLNPAGSLPPVDCPLLIERAPGVLVRATRPAFIERKGNELTYHTDDGETLTGRFRWTYP